MWPGLELFRVPYKLQFALVILRNLIYFSQIFHTYCITWLWTCPCWMTEDKPCTPSKQSNSMKQTEHLELLLHFSHVQQKLEPFSLFFFKPAGRLFLIPDRTKPVIDALFTSSSTNIVFFYDIASFIRVSCNADNLMYS